MTSAVSDVAVLNDSSEAWRGAVDASRDAQLGHAAEWRSIITRTYGHAPLYLTAAADDGSAGVLPAFAVRRPLFGTVITSMPFLDSGGPCSASPALDALLVSRLILLARQRRARLVELRCSRRLPIDAVPLESKVNLTLRLDSPDALWRRFDKGVRNQIRKAERSALTVERGEPSDLALFYDVFVERMRDLGSPVHAFEFLRQVVEAFGRRARVMLVKQQRAVIGGLVALEFKDRVVVPWATCRKEFFAVCPNMVLYWETIKAACAAGFARFDFGRSTRDSGTYRFKRQWGAEEEPLFWYRIAIGADAPAGVKRDRGDAEVLCWMWRHLPLAVTRQIGPRIRKYLIQ
jgi:FemAB-related protein (PEP-CTERM system-associated)